MKRLLILLSVLTTSGTAVPTTIANSPYQKEETIKNSDFNYQQTNNLENLKRNKRNYLYEKDYLSKKLNIIPIVQENKYFCAPTTGLMILRYLSFNQHSNHWTDNDDLSQTNLGFAMQTTSTSGTTQENFVNAINSWIGNRLNRRQYSRLNLNSIYNHILGEGSNTFFQIIRTSLENNMPVALLHNGRSVTTGNLEFQQHAMLFNGYRGNINSPENIIYSFIDPWDGNTHEISARNLFNYSLNWGVSEITAYIPNSQSENQIPNPNQTEPMEIGNCNSHILQIGEKYCVIDIFSNNKIAKREINTNLSCPIINSENPFYDKEDFFQVYYVYAGHDKIKTNLSLKTALEIEKMFYENRKTDFMIYLSNLFKKMEQKDNTGWLGSIKDTDHSTLVNFIYDHYSYFHNKVLELSINKNYNTIEIETNRVGEWNPNYIYLINNK